jgi:DNA recombination protein RmuC
MGETNQAMKDLAARLQEAHETARDAQKQALDAVTVQIRLLTEGNEKKQDKARQLCVADKAYNADNLRDWMNARRV